MVEDGRRATAGRMIVLFLIALAVYVLLARHFWFVSDDAFISFRYARNLATGLGLRYNVGQAAPVEGYSNFLWVLLAAVFERLGLDVTFWMPLISTVLGGLLLWLLWRTCLTRLRLDPPLALAVVLLLAAFPPFALWATGGLATMPFALALFLSFRYLTSGGAPGAEVPPAEGGRPRRGAAAGLAASLLVVVLLRVDGFLWAGLLAVAAIIAQRGKGREFWRRYRWSVVAFAVGVAVYLVWRHAYYGRLMANTAYVKGAMTPATLLRGVRYVVLFFLTFVAPLAAVPGTFFAARRWGSLGAALSVMFWGTVAYAVLVGGDFMAMGRFLVAGFPSMALLVGALLARTRERALAPAEPERAAGARSGHVRLSELRRAAPWALAGGLIAVALLPVWNLDVVPVAVRSAFQFRYNAPVFRSETEQWENMKGGSARWAAAGRALGAIARPGDSIVASAIGNLGYYSNMTVYDMAGLVSPEVASASAGVGKLSPGHDRLVPPQFFLRERPTYIFGELLGGPDARETTAGFMKAWHPILESAPYVPAMIPIGGGAPSAAPGFVFVLRRLRPDENPEAAWQSFLSDAKKVLGSDG